MTELVNSVVTAGRGLNLDIALDEQGGLWITSRSGSPVSPPVAIRFTDESLTEYYRRIARKTYPERSSDWDLWMMLMSTHLYESLYEMGKISGPCAVVIGETGFTAVAEEIGTE
ncbi:hypothetical protein ACL02S_11845 [Nocardia sp. 004]|uniref:hypothetical protein n=1 Tax=Nocardia sp. 004 TaxID=3385978 RepID=UPI0039A16B78